SGPRWPILPVWDSAWGTRFPPALPRPRKRRRVRALQMHFPMRQTRRVEGFTLMELLMAMALFAMAAVSLAGALNLISLSVGESIDEAELREQLRAVVLEVCRDPAIREETRETNPDERGVYFRIAVSRIDLRNEEGESLQDLYQVSVAALREGAG